MLKSTASRAAILLAALAAMALSACESTDPGLSSEDPVGVAGSFDPAASSFTLKTLDAGAPNGRGARVALIGKNLSVDADNSTVSIDVAIHNLSERTLHPQLIVWLDDFRPVEVHPQNADLLPPAITDLPPGGPWGYRYDDQLGADGVLAPQELSDFRSWIFYDPDLAPFRFAARVEFATEPRAARIAGAIFNDEDLDGQLDPGESLFGAGTVFVDAPGGQSSVVQVANDGHYRVFIDEPGLYSARYLPPPTFGFAPLFMTTPNPLEILITAGPDGTPNDFLDAHFGIAAGEGIPRPIEFSDDPPAELQLDDYALIGLAQREQLLVVTMGFSGCSPGHPVKLVMSGDFQEVSSANGAASADLVLVHDDLDELCDAWFQVRRAFNLLPLVARYREQFGRLDPILLRLHLPNGSIEELLLAPVDPTQP